MFVKPLYKRLFPENHSGDCVVYVQSTEQLEKVGNKNPISLTNLFTENVKGIVSVHRINAYKIGVTFKKPAPANNFLSMDTFLSKHNLKAFIPAYMTEVIGVIRHVPTSMSNEDIYKNITCDTEIISVRRFMRKIEGKLVPLKTVTVTFASTVLPQYIYLQLFRYPVQKYIPPLTQCYKCLKFNHSAKVCRDKQMCSSCAGQHSYKECNVAEIICINCGGHHLAISRECPIKIKKMEEKKNKHLNLNRSYATAVSMPPIISDSKTFPSLNKPIFSQPDKKVNNTNKKVDTDLILGNEIIINALVKSLIDLGNNKDSTPITNKRIKEILLSNLI